MKTKIEKWIEMKECLQKLQEEERLLRLEICGELFPFYKEGSNNIKVDNYKITMKAVYTRNIVATVDDVEKVNLPDVFVKKYALSVKELKKLDDKKRAIAESLIETKEGFPQLEVKII